MGRKKLERIYPEEILWIVKHKKCLNLHDLERQIGITKGTLWRFSENRLGLNEKWWPKTVAFVKEMREPVQI